MARQRTSFGKLQRERDKQARLAAKQEKRVARKDETDDEPVEPTPQVDEAKVLAELAALHEAYDAGNVSLDDFETRRAELTQKLTVE